MPFYKLKNLLQNSLIKAWKKYAYRKPENAHKHERNNKLVTKQQGNNDPSSTLTH